MDEYQLGAVIYSTCWTIAMLSILGALFSNRMATILLANAAFWLAAPWLLLLIIIE